MSKTNEDIEALSTEELEKSIKATQAEIEGEAKTEESPKEEVKEEPKDELTYEAGDGTVYKASTEKELFEKVTKALNHTKLALKDRESQIHDLKTRVPKEEKEEPKPAYDHKKYLQLIESDGVAAQEYVDSFRPDVQAQRAERAQAEEANKLRDEVLKFYKKVPDYAKVETPELNELVKSRMKEEGRTYTADALIATYYELKIEGKIPEPAKGEPVKERKAMPSTPSSANTETEEGEGDYDNMSSKELIAQMKKSGVPGAEYLH